MAEWVDDFGNRLVNVHSDGACGRLHCTIHSPSNHAMTEFPQLWRVDRRIMERICPHGIGHPDPDEVRVFDRTHGCDGCCVEESRRDGIE